MSDTPTDRNGTGTKCPVCGNIFTGYVCPTCGWALIVYPADVPEAIARFESARTDAARAALTARRQAEERAAKAEEQLRASEAEIKTIRGETDMLRDNVSKARTRIATTEAALREKEADTEALRAEADSLRRQLSEAQATVQAEAFLIVRNPDGDISALGIGGAASRVVNSATLRADPSAKGAGMISVFTPSRIDFTIEHCGDRFVVDDRGGNLLVNGRKPQGKTRILNNSTLTFAGIDGLTATFSIPAKAR